MPNKQNRPRNEPRDNLRELLTPKNETSTSADLYFYGEIVSEQLDVWADDDQCPAAVRDFLRDHDGKTLNIYINSVGGSVFGGMAIYSMLRRYNGYKTVYVDGVAASIASVIALAGDRIVVPSNAFLMIHKPWEMCIGNADDMRKRADDLDRIEAGILNIYGEHLAEGVDIADIERMVDAETWLSGDEAAKYFRVEVGDAKEYAAMLTESAQRFKNLPREVAASAKDDETDEQNESPAAAEKITRLAIEAITNRRSI